MRLLKVILHTKYKGLQPQTFDFTGSKSGCLCFIGLNGSGKSQLLELIAESFSYLERFIRKDFKVRRPLSVDIELYYQCKVFHDAQGEADFHTHIYSDSVEPKLRSKPTGEESWSEMAPDQIRIPTYIVAHASGLNENLERPFMKNSLQFSDAIRVKKNRSQALDAIAKEVTANEEEFNQKVSETNRKYLKNYPGIFELDVFYSSGRETSSSQNVEIQLRENVTKLTNLLYLNQDALSIQLLCCSLLPAEKQEKLLKPIGLAKISTATVRYNLRNVSFDQDLVLDIKQFLRVFGSSERNLKGIGQKTTDDEYDQYELDYLAAEIKVDFTADIEGNTALNQFVKLMKLHLIETDNWQGEVKRSLRKDDSFSNSVRPEGLSNPLMVSDVVFEDEYGNHVMLCDLSDGQTQLLQVLSAMSLFEKEDALFLLDEPDTHLNPAWRTNYYSFISDFVGPDSSIQAAMSTHSPFIISSVTRNDVFVFRKQDGGSFMSAAQSETYGSSFDVLIKEYFGLQSLISQSVITEIREQLTQGDDHAREWIEENLGLSAEKAYLIRRLSQ